MGRRNVERTVLSCLKCRSDISSCKTPRAAYLPLRLSHTARKGGNFIKDNVYHEKKARKVKVGNKWYIFEETEASPLKEKCTILTPSSSALSHLSHGLSAQDQDVSNPSSSGRSKVIRSKDQSLKSVADLESTLAPYSREGLEFASILRQPLSNRSAERPFLSKVQTLTVDENSNNFSYHVASIKDVLQAAKTITDHVRSQLRNEVNLRKLGPHAFKDYVNDSKVHLRDFENLLLEYFKTGDDTLSVVSPVIEAYWESLRPILKDISEPLCLQKTAIHAHLRYKTDIDFVAYYKSKPCVIKFQMASWKNSIDEKILLDNRLYLLGCLGAVNFDPSWSHQISSAVLIRAYSDGSPADALVNNLKGSQYHWKVWLRMVEQFWRQYDKQSGDKETSDIDLQFKEESNKDSQRPLAEEFTSAPQFNRKMTNETDPSILYRNSDLSLLSNQNCKMHPSDSAEVSAAKEQNLCHQTNEDTIPGVTLKKTPALVIDQSENDAKLVKPAVLNSNRDPKCHGKYEQAATPSEDIVSETNQRPQTRLAVVLNSLKNLWKS